MRLLTRDRIVRNISSDHWAKFSELLDRADGVSSLSEDIRKERELLFRTSLEKYLQLLIEKNEVINLTAIGSFEEAVWKHLFDSLLLVELEPLGFAVDWGTGGGVPGIPLALFRKHMLGLPSKVLFLDSVAKKLRCVEEFAGALALDDARFFVGRGETLLRTEKIETVIMRAVAPPSRAINWVSRAANNWVFMTGPRGVEEWGAYLGQMRKLGFGNLKTIERDVPFNQGKRFLLKFSR